MSGRRVVATISVASALRGLGTVVLMTFLPVYAVLVGMDMADVGSVVAVTTAIGVAVTPFTGIAADILGSRTLLAVSTLMLCAAPLLPLYIRSWVGVALAYTFLNLSMYTWMPARGAAVAGSVDRRSMGTSFAVVSLSFQLVRMFAPYIAGVGIRELGYDVVFTTVSLLALATTGVIVVGVPGKRRRAERPTLSDIAAGIAPKKREVPFHVFLSVDRVGWRLWMPMLNTYLRAHLGFPEDVIGFISSVRGAASAVAVLGAGRMVDRYGWRLVLALSEVTGALGALLMAIARSPEGFAAAMAMVGLSIALWMPGYNVAVPHFAGGFGELGRAYARAGFYRSIASIPAPWIGGLIAALGPTVPMLVGSLMLFANTGLVAWLRPVSSKCAGDTHAGV